MAQVRLQGLGNRSRDSALGLLAGGRESLAIRLQPCEPFPLRPRSVPKEHPLQGDATNSAIPRRSTIKPRGSAGKVLRLGHFFTAALGTRMPGSAADLPL